MRRNRVTRELLAKMTVQETSGTLPPSNGSPYRNGYEGWSEFDNLPANIREAHNVVWTGHPHYTNQHHERTFMAKISPEDALAIVELDGSKNMLSSDELCGDMVFDSRNRW